MRRLDAKEMAVTLSADIDAVPGELRSFNVELRNARQLVFHYPPSTTHSGEILAAVQRAGLTVTDLVTREADLEDIFLRLTSQPEEETP